MRGCATHPWVPDLAIFPHVPVADSFLLAKQVLFPAEDALQLDRRAFAAACVRGIRTDDEADWRVALARIRETFSDDPPAQAWFDSTFGNHPFAPAPPFQIRSPYPGFDGDFLHLAAERFGVADVEGAVRLCQSILGTSGAIRYGLKSHRQLSAEWVAAHADVARVRHEADRLGAEWADARADAAQSRQEANRLGAECAACPCGRGSSCNRRPPLAVRMRITAGGCSPWRRLGAACSRVEASQTRDERLSSVGGVPPVSVALPSSSHSARPGVAAC